MKRLLGLLLVMGIVGCGGDSSLPPKSSHPEGDKSPAVVAPAQPASKSKTLAPKAGTITGTDATHPEPQTTSLAQFIEGKRIHFQAPDGSGPFWAEFSADGTTRHSARGAGTFKVEGLKVDAVDFEQVELIFPKANIAAGDTFEAKATGAEKGLLFEVLKVEPISGNDPTND